MKKNFLSQDDLSSLNTFIKKYGHEGLKAALLNYDFEHQTYLYKNKSLVKRIPICSIDYVEIFGHKIMIHTAQETFTKYGTLKEEHMKLKSWGFVRCNQSFLIPLSKVLEIRENQILLNTGDTFTLSRSYEMNVINAYIASLATYAQNMQR